MRTMGMRTINQPGGVPGLGRVPVPRVRDNGTLMFVGLLMVVIAASAGTLWVAHQLGNPPGPSIAVPLVGRLYEPFHGVVWLYMVMGKPAFHLQSHAFQAYYNNLLTQFIGIFGGSFIGLMIVLSPLPKRLAQVPQILADGEFARDAEIRKWGYVGGTGPVVGRRKMSDRGVSKYEVIRANGEGHQSFTMGTGAGKDRSVIKRTLLDDASKEFSWLINDPPSEEWQATAGASRSELGARVFRCAWGLDRDHHPEVARWNGWDEIPYDKRDAMVASLLAHKHVDLDGSGMRGKNRYFYKGGIDIATLAGLVVHYGKEKEGLRASGAGIVDMLMQFGESSDAFSEFLDFARNFDHSCGGKYSWIDGDGRPSKRHPAIMRLCSMLSMIKGDEFAPVFATFQQGFSLYTFPIIAENTEASDVSVRGVMDGDEPWRVYMETEVADEDTLMPLVMCFYELFFAFNQSSAYIKIGPDGRQYHTHKRECYFFWNEAFSSPKIRAIEKGATTARKFGIHIVPFFQKEGQSQQLFGENNSIDGLMGFKTYTAAGDPTAAEKISKAIGSHTIGYDTTTISEKGGISYQLHLNSSPLVKQDQVGRTDLRYRYCVPLGRKPFVVEADNYDDYPELVRRSVIPPPPLSDSMPPYALPVVGRGQQVKAEKELVDSLREQFDDAELGVTS